MPKLHDISEKEEYLAQILRTRNIISCCGVFSEETETDSIIDIMAENT